MTEPTSLNVSQPTSLNVSQPTSLNDFLEINTGEIWKQFKKELPTQTDPVSIDKLKKMAVYAEAIAMDIAVYSRRLSIHADKLAGELSDEYDAKCASGAEKPSTAGRTQYIKIKSSVERSWQKELEDLQDIIKRRVLLAQSLLKSATTESVSHTNQDFRI